MMVVPPAADHQPTRDQRSSSSSISNSLASISMYKFEFDVMRSSSIIRHPYNTIIICHDSTAHSSILRILEMKTQHHNDTA